jgi:chemosensory pili system protein ChpA (sensor histidine kinase/response regulator)
MRTPNRVDTSTLGWVKNEIDQTLGQAREALQRYVDGRDDLTPLRLFANSVHQVAGTLQMVELDGAAQLAQETESLASAVVSGKIKGNGSPVANELLGEGLNHLSNYMERLANGLPDRPIDNVDVINELRRARQAEALDPYSLFQPDLEVYPSRDRAATEVDTGQYEERARDLRRRFQGSLLKWLRDQKNEGAWQELVNVVTELYELSRFQVSMQIWWVARAYLDILKDVELSRDDPRKHALAQLDQLMRKLSENSEAAIAREGAEKPVRFMLYHIGRSGVSTEATRAVVHLFDLDALLGAESGEAPPPEASALATIREQVAEPLALVQSALENYSRTKIADDDFEACERRLNEVADAARENGVNELAEVSAGVRQALFDGDQPDHSEEALLTAARALLFIEQSLTDPERITGAWRTEAASVLDQLAARAIPADLPSLAIESHEIDADALEADELRRLVTAVAGQIADSLKEAEQNLEQYSKDTSDNDSLAAVVESLGQVHGAVRMLGRHKLCDLLELAIAQIRSLMTGDAFPSDALLDALAVSIGTTEAYVEGMERDVPNIDALLGRAMTELESAESGDSLAQVDPVFTLRKIRDSFAVWTENNSDYETYRTLRQSLRDIGAAAHQQEQLSLQRIAQEMINLLDIVTDDPSFLSEEVEKTLSRSLDTLSGLAESLKLLPDAQATPESVAGSDSGDADSDGEEDEIVREVFAEEARECLQTIEENLRVLAADHGSEAALGDVRRSFHTIKGSGRMAKARGIAELAWIVEDVLNRCLEGDVPVSESVVDFASRARTELSKLLESGLDSSTDLRAWRERASAVQPSGGGGAAQQEISPASEIASPSEAGAAKSVGFTHPEADRGTPAPLSIEDLGEEGHDLAGAREERDSESPFDDEVIKIFSKEALSHIAAIRTAIDECNRRGDAGIGDEFLRAVHTLQGNARSLHLVEMSEAYTALDRALHARKARGEGLYKEDMEALDSLLIATAKVLDHLNRDKRFPDVVRHELTELAGRIEESWNEAKSADDVVEKKRSSGLELVSEFVTGTRRFAEEPEEPQESGPAVDESAGASVFDRLDEAKPEDASRPATADAGLRKQTVEAGTGVEERESASENADADADAGLKDVFMEEAADILSRFESTLQHGREAGVGSHLANTLKRELHTLKGSARAAGVENIGDLSHDAETMLESASDEGPESHGELLDLLEEVHDTLANMVQALEGGDAPKAEPRLIERLRAGSGAPRVQPAPNPEAARPAVSLIPEEGMESTPGRKAAAEGRDTGQPETIAEEAPARESDQAGQPPRPATPRATVRIHSNVLDKLVNYAGEVSISRSQIEEQLSGLKGNLNELRANVARFSDQVRELDIQADTQIRSRVAEEQVSEAGHDFDPLEMDRYSRLQQLSRSLSESLDDLVTIQAGLNRFATQTEGALSQQAMLNSELQDGLMSARMVPFNTLVPRLRHQTRQTARELGKQVDFQVSGADIEVDRNILDQLSEALDHMIRNSLDHGIESADVRSAAGKPARGSVRIDCRQEGNEVVLKFSDDGAGLDVDRIKTRAVEAGLLAADSDLSDDEIIQLIVLSGFSTARSVTQLSGRGVGLDVVNDAVRRLGGSLSLENRPGAGVSFELRLPLSLSITRAMFVRCGDQRFAIPLGVIETVMKTEPENLVEVSKDGDPLFRHDDRVYTLMDLTATLGLEPAVPGKRIPVLLVRMGARDVAVRVDDLIETDEIVVKQLGDHLGRISSINGATITGDGSVVLILDLAALWLAQERVPAIRQEVAPSKVDALPKVMVVDDSLTVRKVTGRNLGRHGMEVIMARDGIDALDQLVQGKPDLMLIDIEMPRMDGYELTTRIREDPNYRDIPIIVITSRAGSKHRERAMELGANAYLTKPYQERELLEQVNALLKRAPQSTVH